MWRKSQQKLQQQTRIHRIKENHWWFTSNANTNRKTKKFNQLKYYPNQVQPLQQQQQQRDQQPRNQQKRYSDVVRNKSNTNNIRKSTETNNKETSSQPENAVNHKTGITTTAKTKSTNYKHN